MPEADDRITELLVRLRASDENAGAELLPRLYDDLHAKAAALMRDERRQVTLQPTALMHEAWLRIRQSPGATWADRAHFLRFAGRAMRNVQVDHARRRRHGRTNHSGSDEGLAVAIGPEPADRVDVLDLQEALQRLGREDEELERVVELRFSAG